VRDATDGTLSLDEFIAALPECPDCGEKLHRFAYCPGRSRIRPEAMQDPTQTENEGVTMSNAVVTKQGVPSKPGEVVDTSKAKVVPPSSEVIAEHAKDAEFMARTHAAGLAEKSKKEQNAKVKATTKAPAAKAAAKGNGSTKAKPAAKRSTGNGSGPAARLTMEWLSKSKKEVSVKDKVKLADGTAVTVVGRWTKHTKAGNVPFITGTTADGTRQNSAASEVTHTK
jgi:hypothetical protein